MNDIEVFTVAEARDFLEKRRLAALMQEPELHFVQYSVQITPLANTRGTCKPFGPDFLPATWMLPGVG